MIPMVLLPMLQEQRTSRRSTAAVVVKLETVEANISDAYDHRQHSQRARWLDSCSCRITKDTKKLIFFLAVQRGRRICPGLLHEDGKHCPNNDHKKNSTHQAKVEFLKGQQSTETNNAV
jgi:hypothetical protein